MWQQERNKDTVLHVQSIMARRPTSTQNSWGVCSKWFRFYSSGVGPDLLWLQAARDGTDRGPHCGLWAGCDVDHIRCISRHPRTRCVTLSSTLLDSLSSGFWLHNRPNGTHIISIFIRKKWLNKGARFCGWCKIHINIGTVTVTLDLLSQNCELFILL